MAAVDRAKEITVNLLANGKKIKESKATADTNWEYSFADLPKYEGGKEIEYIVTENTVKGYSTDIKGYEIKNSYTPKKTSVTVTKRWNDGNDKDKIRPESIKVQLYANGEKKGEAECDILNSLSSPLSLIRLSIYSRLPVILSLVSDIKSILLLFLQNVFLKNLHTLYVRFMQDIIKAYLVLLSFADAPCASSI